MSYSQKKVINLQGIMYKKEGDVLKEKDIILNLKILENNQEGNLKYSEKHTIKTDRFGFFKILIGSGTLIGTKTFESVNWQGEYFISIEQNSDDILNITGLKFNSTFYSLFSEKTYNFNTFYISDLLDVSITNNELNLFDSTKIIIWKGKKWGLSEIKREAILKNEPTGKISLVFIPSYVFSTIQKLGDWDAATNYPVIQNGGEYYSSQSQKIIKADTGNYFDIINGSILTNVDNNSNWLNGGKIIFNGNIWQAIPPVVENIPENSITSEKIQNYSIGTLQIADNSITSSKIKNGEVKNENLSSNIITTKNILNEEVKSIDIAKNNIDGSKIFQEEIKSVDLLVGLPIEKFADNCVTNSKLEAKSIGSNKIVNSNIIPSLINNYQITSTKIANDALTNSKLKDLTLTNLNFKTNAFNSEKIEDSTILSEDIANDAITSSLISNFSINSEKIGLEEITGNNINDNAIENKNIGKAQVDGSKIANNVITSVKIKPSSLIALDFAKYAITGDKIADNQITKTKIQNISGESFENSSMTKEKIDTVGLGNFSKRSITADKIDDNSIGISVYSTGGAHFTTHSIFGSALKNTSCNCPTTSHFYPNSITSFNITTNTLLGEKFDDSALVPIKIRDNAITPSKLKLNSLFNTFGVNKTPEANEIMVVQSTDSKPPISIVYTDISNIDNHFIDFNSNNTTTQGYISQNPANNVLYSTFTGSHLGHSSKLIKNNSLVCFTNDGIIDNKKFNYTEQIYDIEICNIKNSKKVAGVIMNLKDSLYKSYIYLFNAEGNSTIDVIIKENKNIEIGDYLVSSDVEGYAEIGDKNSNNYFFAKVVDKVRKKDIKYINGDKLKISRVSIYLTNFLSNTKSIENIKQNLIDFEKEINEYAKSVE